MTLTRVNYVEGMVLSASDLNDEQSFLIGLRRRHKLGPHDWGILSGLDLILDRGDMTLTPGVAVDGYGRELYVIEPIILDPATFKSPSGQVQNVEGQWLDYWLRYGRVPVALPQQGIYACGPGQFNRWQEQARLWITRAPRDGDGNLRQIDPRTPPGVPQQDLNLGPQDDLPDDPNCVWPVYLGRANFDASNVQIDPSVQRPYAVLVGAVTRSASRQLVPDDPQKPSPPPPIERAHMELAPAVSGKPLFAIRVADKAGKLIDRLAVKQDGDVNVTGHTTIVSDMLPAERLPTSPLTQQDTDGLISILHLNPVGFTSESILEPRLLADKILYGQLRIHARVKQRIDDLFQLKPASITISEKGGNARQQEKNIPQGLAKILNTLIHGTLLVSSQNPNAVRLSRETWAMINSLPRNADPSVVNMRVLAEYLGEQVVAAPTSDKAWALKVGTLPQPPQAALPWQLYRIASQDPNQPASSEMRFEILDPGKKDDPTHYQWMVGYQQKTKFEPCLRLDAAGNVQVNGNLIVQGAIVVVPPAPDPSSPNFVAQLSQSWAQALAAGILASAMLKIEIVQPTINAVDHTKWGYTAKLTNRTSGAINNVALYDIYSLDGSTRPTTLVDAGPHTIAANSSLSLPISHTEPGDVSGKQVGLVVFAVGYGPGNTAVYGSANTLTTL